MRSKDGHAHIDSGQKSVLLLRERVQVYPICQSFPFIYSTLRFAEDLETIPGGTDSQSHMETNNHPRNQTCG